MAGIISTHVGEETLNFGDMQPKKLESIKDKYPNAHIDPLSTEVNVDEIVAQFANVGEYDWNDQEYKKYNVTKESLTTNVPGNVEKPLLSGTVISAQTVYELQHGEQE